MAIADLEQRPHLLVDDQRCRSFPAQLAQRAPDLLTHQRRQPLGRSVEDDQRRVGEQGARDAQHLLLAAGELRAKVFEPFADAGKKRQHALHRPRTGPRGDEKIFPRSQRGKDAAPFRHQRDALARDPVRRPPRDRSAAHAHLAGARRREAERAADGGRLAHAVATHQRDGLAGGNGKIHAVQDMAVAVEGM